MNSLNEQALEEYNRVIEEAKKVVIEQLSKSQEIYEKFSKKINIEENISKKIDFQNFVLPSSGNKEKIYIKEDLLRTNEKYIKEKFQQIICLDNESNQYFVKIDSETKKNLYEKNFNKEFISSITELQEILILLYEKEFHKLQHELKIKNKQYSEMEKAYSETLHLTKRQYDEIEELHHLLHEESTRFKTLISELSESFKKGKKEEINKIIFYLTNNINDFDGRINKLFSTHKSSSKKSNIESFSNNDNYLNYLKNAESYEELSNSFKISNKLESEIHPNSKNIINDFENVIGEEFMRVEGYYKKDKTPKKQRINNSNSKRKKTEIEKNYVEWKPKGSWLLTLRSDSTVRREQSTINTENSKDRIRNSIRNILTITEKKDKQSRTITEDNNTIRSNEIINTDNYLKPSNRSVSQNSYQHVPEAIQKNIILQNKIKESVDKKLRKLVFNYRKKEKI